MNWLNRVERKVKWLTIPNVTLPLIILQSLAWLLLQLHPEFSKKLILERSLLFDGQWWRLLTFILLPPRMNVILLYLALYVFYLTGTVLEKRWGTFRYNLYLLIGYIASIGAVLIVPGGVATNIFIGESVFIAFAYLYPDFEFLLYFILPVKSKWLAVAAWIVYAYEFAEGDWLQRALVCAAVLNFFLFFGLDILQNAKLGHRRMKIRMESAAASDGAINRCVICGKTEKSDPKAEFRYCPQCTGTPCYCMPHMLNHAHR